MIRGIGIDIMEIARVRQSIEEHGKTFLEKVFTPGEISYCTSKANKYQHFAARFAAKEAVSKALATGWTGGFVWKNVEVTNDPAGQPHIALSGRLRERLADCSVLISISHAENHVVAVAVIDDGPPRD